MNKNERSNRANFCDKTRNFYFVEKPTKPRLQIFRFNSFLMTAENENIDVLHLPKARAQLVWNSCDKSDVPNLLRKPAKPFLRVCRFPIFNRRGVGGKSLRTDIPAQTHPHKHARTHPHKRTRTSATETFGTTRNAVRGAETAPLGTASCGHRPAPVDLSESGAPVRRFLSGPPPRVRRNSRVFRPGRRFFSALPAAREREKLIYDTCNIRRSPNVFASSRQSLFARALTRVLINLTFRSA